MNKKFILRGGVAAVACLSLSACLGSNTVAGGGGGGGGGGGDYTANLDRVQALGPQTQRQSGTINYAGQTRVETNVPGASAPNGFFIGDVLLAANFDNGSLSGTATNFAGEVDGTAVTLDGTLSSANTTDPNIVTQADITVPVVGGTITSGSLIGALRGNLTESVNNESTLTQLVLGGSFLGTNATSAAGIATLLLGEEGEVGFVATGNGTFWVDRQ